MMIYYLRCKITVCGEIKEEKLGLKNNGHFSHNWNVYEQKNAARN